MVDEQPSEFDRAMAAVWLAETKGEFLAAKAVVGSLVSPKMLTWTMQATGIDYAHDPKAGYIYFRVKTDTHPDGVAPGVQSSQDAAILVTVLQRYIHDCKESGDRWRLTPPAVNTDSLDFFDDSAGLTIDGHMVVWNNEYPALHRILRPGEPVQWDEASTG